MAGYKYRSAACGSSPRHLFSPSVSAAAPICAHCLGRTARLTAYFWEPLRPPPFSVSFPHFSAFIKAGHIGMAMALTTVD
jgi:hypothetical protein